MSRNVCVLGLGYIGLPTASLLATKGHQVLGVDVDPDIVATIGRGDIHLVEPDLDVLVRSAVQSGNLKAALEPSPADVFIIAVPTPFRDDHQPDLRFVEAATRALAPHLAETSLVILESTSPVGTSEHVVTWLTEERPDLGDAWTPRVAHCPERVLPGHILRELVDNDRIVGGVDAPSTEAAVQFYRSFVRGEVIGTTARTAEMCKLVENASRDVNIAFANELSMVCKRLDIDVWEVIELANRHPRVDILRPGPGVGGHCLAVDPWFIVAAAPEDSRLIRTGREVNLAKTQWVIGGVAQAISGLDHPVIACLGLAYKPDIDDLRESPALEVYEGLKASLPHAEVIAVEPNLPDSHPLPRVSLEEALGRANVLVGLVAHRAFRNLDRAAIEGHVVIDICGVFR